LVIRHEIAADLVGIDEMRHAEALAPLLLGIVGVDPDDHLGTHEPQSLDHVEADAAQPEHDAFRARLDLCGVDHCAYSGRHPAADVTDLLERSVLANFRDRDLRQHGEIRKGRAAHIVMHHLAADGEARAAVGHHATSLRCPDGGAEIGLARKA
jgi:hypothetical protein